MAAWWRGWCWCVACHSNRWKNLDEKECEHGGEGDVDDYDDDDDEKEAQEE